MMRPKPLFDNLAHHRDDMTPCVGTYLDSIEVGNARETYRISREFLTSYAGSEDTYNAYRREIERFIQWCWLVKEKGIPAIDRNDIRDYLTFLDNPPKNWVGVKNVARFKSQDGLRAHNPEWCPFVVRISKAKHREGESPKKENFKLSNKSRQVLLATLSTYFTFLMQEGYVENNPVTLIRQKKQFVQRTQQKKVTRLLNDIQWKTMLDIIEQRAEQDPSYERHLFMMSAFYLLGLRISELAETPGRVPQMGDFAPDKHGNWWFTTVGKGNKVRDIAVPDTMMDALKRYRLSLNLHNLPQRDEDTPLLHKQRGKGGLGTRQIRNLVQHCFDAAIEELQKNAREDEANDLSHATVHWLRHTAISADINFRPREHVRDDAGHENASTTDQYIDVDRIERHQSARNKPLRPGNPDNYYRG